MAAAETGRGFSFLFRTDQGQVDRATWWKGTVCLAVIGGLATAGWLAVRPYTADALHQPPALAVLGYVYLMVYAFAVLLLLICEYNLSAKRFFARGWPRAVAAILPLSILGAAALAWYAPRASDFLPGWSLWVGIAIVIAVVLWNLVELGIRGGR